MPYSGIADLPATVRSHLPRHAQEIYLSAFNNAWREYAERADHEVVAHKVAWAAVGGEEGLPQGRQRMDAEVSQPIYPRAAVP